MTIEIPENKLIMLSGLPASGKSTLAQTLLKIIPWSIRLNKDSLRKMFFFGEWTWQNEKEVMEMEEILAELYLNSGRTVIIDDTNLTLYHKNKWMSIAKKLKVEFIEKELLTSWQECVERDSKRVDKVGEYVIKNFALSQGLVEGKFVICDLDGTLCDITHRLHFVKREIGKKDWKSFFENLDKDTLRLDVAMMISYLNGRGYKIVFVSGRSEEYKEQTIDWLKKNGIDYNFSLIMRKKGDKRDDVVVKKEILNKYFNDMSKVFMVIDDRPSVLRMWNEQLGKERVINVGDNIEF